MKHLLYVAALLCLSIAFVACGDDDDDDNNNNEPGNGTDSDTGTPDAGVEGDSESDTTPAGPVKPEVAFEENFDSWDGGGAIFFMSKPETAEDIMDDNNTAANIGEQDCVMFHANTVDNYGHGGAIEAQFELVSPKVDFSDEDYEISFDIYMPQATKDKGVNIQFAFFETDSYQPIYSKMYFDEITADEWVTISGRVYWDEDKTVIDYSGFDTSVNPDANPGDWQFDVLRIQAGISNEGEEDADFGIGEEVLFYIDNLSVKLVEE